MNGSDNNKSMTSGSTKNYASEHSTKFLAPGNKPDPYVQKAIERAKNKLRDRIFEINGRHV